MLRYNGFSVVIATYVLARVHVPKTDDADADTDDDAGPCEDIVVLAKTHSGASEDTYCGSGTLTMGHPWSIQVRNIEYRSGTSNTGPELRIQVRKIKKCKKIKNIILYIKNIKIYLKNIKKVS